MLKYLYYLIKKKLGTILAEFNSIFSLLMFIGFIGRLISENEIF